MSVGKVLLDILVVLLAAKVAAEAAERARVPAVVGEIVAGIIVGPSALGLVGGDDVLRTLAELGVILLLFDVGMEMDLAELAAVGRASLLVATVGVVVPFVGGLGAGLALGMTGDEALFVGAALTATSVGITARVFGDLRALGSVEARTVLGAAVADDVMGLVILTVVIRIATTGGVTVGRVLGVVAVALAFLIVATAVGLRAAPVAFAFVTRHSRSAGTLVALALAFALAFAELANTAKLAPIVGAFVAGICLGTSPAAERARRELTPVGHLFIPVFFLQVGIDADLAQFAHRRVLGIAAVLLVIAVAGKLVSCIGLGRMPADRLLVGVGMIPRGEVGLIFATIGLREHVFGDDVYGALLLVVLVTTLITPPVLRWRLLRNRAASTGSVSSPEPPGGWLQILPRGGGTVELVGDPPPQLALRIGLDAALLGETNRPGAHLLDWLSKLPEQPLRWDGPARAALVEVLESGRTRTWRFLALTGLLDRGLPEIGEALARRHADAFELDPSGALRWPRLSQVIESDERRELDRSDLVVLAALVLDAAGDGGRAPAVVAARRVAQRLDLGARGEEALAGLVGGVALLTAAVRRLDAYDEERILGLAAHLETPEQARGLYLLALAEVGDNFLERQRLAELHHLIQQAMGRPDLTGPEASNIVNQRRAEAGRLVADPAVRGRIEAAPRAYVLATPPEALARQAALCEPVPPPGTVRVAVNAARPGRWTVDVVAEHGPERLVRHTMVLADFDLDVREAVLATWADGLTLSSFLVEGATEPEGSELAGRMALRGGPPPALAAPDVVVAFDHDSSPWHTLCVVRGPNRPRLLATLAASFAIADVDVHAARITGEGTTVLDEFELTDPQGGKLRPATEQSIVRTLEGGRPPRRRRWAHRRFRPAAPERPPPRGGGLEPGKAEDGGGKQSLLGVRDR